MRHQATLQLLAKRSYNSYLARLHAEKRLRKIGNYWNAAQFGLSTALVSVSIIFLPFPNRQDAVFAVLVVSLAVLALVVSIVVTFLDYSARAKAMFSNYRTLQAFSVRIETLLDVRRKVSIDELTILQSEYDSIMDTSENHLALDHNLAQARQTTNSIPVNLIPSILTPLLLPAGLVIVAISTVVLAVAAIN